MTGGRQFEKEIREQPAVLARLASAQAGAQLDAAIGERDPVFIGSGSSLFMAQLAALAWRRRGGHAAAIAATEVAFQAEAQRRRCVVALSQSGRTADVLTALDTMLPSRTIALTNDLESPLARRADVVIDLAAGAERAVPASKSVTAMAAVVIGATARASAGDAAVGRALAEAAEQLEAWFSTAMPALGESISERFDRAESIVIVGNGYGIPVASEIALKIKEASYRHAEGFGAGEFRHGSTAILDPRRGLIGLADETSRGLIGRMLENGAEAGAVTLTLGDAVPNMPAFGPPAAGMFAPISWIVGGQMLALAFARRAGIDCDTPRGLKKYLG